MGDSVAPACVNVIPDAAGTAFQIHRMKRSAYTAVLRSFCAQSDLLSGTKEECLVQLRKELKILETEHGEYLVEARSNKQMKSLSAGMSERSTCNNKVMKDTPELGSTVPDGDTAVQIHCLQRSAYASVLRAFGAVTNHLSWLQVKLLGKLRNELSVSHTEHKEVLGKVISDEHIKHLRKFSMENYSVLMKMDAAFHAQPLVPDKITSTEQLSTSSTTCPSLAQKSTIPERSRPSIRDNDVLGSSSRVKEGSCFESHAATRLRSICKLTLAFLERLPSFEQLTEKGCTEDTLDRETLTCEVKAGCTISPIFQEKNSQSNASQVPSCVDDHGRKESRKRKTEVPVMKGYKSQCVVDRTNGIYYKEQRNKDSNLEHGTEIFKIRLTADLLNKVEKIIKENLDPANLDTAMSMLKAHEKDLLDALAELSKVSKDEAYNGQLAKVINHDEMQPRPVSSADKTPPETTTTSPSANSTVILQAPPEMETLPHAAALLCQKRRADAPPPPRQPDKKQRPRVKNKCTAEQKQRRLELAHRIGWAAPSTTDDSAAVEVFCAQVGISRRAFLSWMYYNKHKIVMKSLTRPPAAAAHE